jgi:hypothetical protein
MLSMVDCGNVRQDQSLACTSTGSYTTITLQNVNKEVHRMKLWWCIVYWVTMSELLQCLLFRMHINNFWYHSSRQYQLGSRLLRFYLPISGNSKFSHKQYCNSIYRYLSSINTRFLDPLWHPPLYHKMNINGSRPIEEVWWGGGRL